MSEALPEEMPRLPEETPRFPEEMARRGRLVSRGSGGRKPPQKKILPLPREGAGGGPRLLAYTILILGAVLSVLPFAYMLLTSLKTYGSVITNTVWPWAPFASEPFQWGNYPTAIQAIGFDRQWGTWLFVRYLANSLIVSLATAAGAVVTSTLAAYALARIELPGKRIVFLLVLATVMVPEDLTLVPKVVMMYDFGWYNSYLALIVPFTVSVFGIFLLRQFFRQVPRDLYEAAVIDGMGHLRFLFFVALPLCRPAQITLAVMTFIWSWDSFKWPLLVTRDANMRVLGVGLQQFMQGEGSNVQLLMAFATLVTLPMVVLYLFAQRYFRVGVMTSGIKG